MMGTLQKYFTYRFTVHCGIPSMTLLGERSDWEDILARLEKLKTLGNEPTYWYHLLKPVVTRFVMTFDKPASPEITDFWTRIIHRKGGSGIDRITGWLTAFCLWKEDGQLLYDPNGFTNGRSKGARKQDLCLDGQTYGRFDMEDLPRGYSTVPVTYNDNGDEFETILLAGSVGIKCSSSGKLTAEGQTGLDTLQPMSGWWIYERKRWFDEADWPHIKGFSGWKNRNRQTIEGKPRVGADQVIRILLINLLAYSLNLNNFIFMNFFFSFLCRKSKFEKINQKRILYSNIYRYEIKNNHVF